MSSTRTRDSKGLSSSLVLSSPGVEDVVPSPSLEVLQNEEAQAEQDENEAYDRRRRAAAQLALERGLASDGLKTDTVTETKGELVYAINVPEPSTLRYDNVVPGSEQYMIDELKVPLPSTDETPSNDSMPVQGSAFVPARLPRFG